MATDLTREFEIIFSGNKTDLDATMSGLDRNFDGFTSKIEGFAEPLSQVTDGILAMDAALAAMVIGGLALAIKKGGEFGDQFGEIATLVDLPRKSLEGFSKNILDYSRDSGKAIEDINAAIYTAISAGTDYEDSLSLLTQTERLAIAGRGDLESTTKLLASTLNAYGEDVSQAERYSDIFFTTVKDGQITIPELAAKLSKVTGIAAGAKIPLETLAAAIAGVTASGLPASEAISGIKESISNIIKPSAEAQRIAGELEIGFNATALEARGYDGILRDVYEATGGNVEQMGKLFGSTEALNVALVLSADTSGKFGKALDDMANSAQATSIAYEKVKDDFTNINQQIANNVNATLIGLGLRLEDEYGQVAGGVISILKGIGTELDKGTFDPLINLVEKLGGDLGALLNGIAEAMPEAFEQVDFAGLLDSLSDMGLALDDMFDNLDLSDPADLAKAIQGVIDTVESLVRITTGIGESFKPFFEAIKEGIKHVNDLDEADKVAFGNLLGAAKLVTVAGVEIVAALALIEQSGFSMSRAFDVVFGGVRIGINALQTSFDQIVLGIGKSIEGLLSTANFVSFGQIDGLAEAVEDIKEFNAAVQQHSNEQVADMAAGWDQVAGNVEKTGQAMADIPTEVSTTITATGKIDPEIEVLLDGKETFEKAINLSVDDQSVIQAKAALADVGGGAFFDADTGTWTNVFTISPEVDQDKASEARKELDREFAFKTIELETEFDIASLEANAATAQAAFQFKAEIDIAEIEASARTIESLGDGIEAVFTSSADTVSALFSELSDIDLSSVSIRDFIEKMYDKENDLRQKALTLQEKLVDSQIAYQDAKTESLQNGDAVISVTADGLEPEIEAFMWRILERVQIRANAEQAEFLLGG